MYMYVYIYMYICMYKPMFNWKSKSVYFCFKLVQIVLSTDVEFTPRDTESPNTSTIVSINDALKCFNGFRGQEVADRRPTGSYKAKGHTDTSNDKCDCSGLIKLVKLTNLIIVITYVILLDVDKWFCFS